MNIKILVATHKQYIMPNDNDMYIPVQVGCDEVSERFGYQQDNEGDNISYKHRYYSDLSSLYWGWKNLDVDYLGTCHYRRYFVTNKAKKTNDPFFKYILSKKEAIDLLQKCPVIVAKKRRYYIETIASHYSHTHSGKDLDTAWEVVRDIYPEYLNSFEIVLKRSWAHMFNTFIMRKKELDAFCEWMFTILFELEKRIDTSNYDVYESRVCGYIAEFLLDTWLEKNNIQYQEVELKFMEPRSLFKKYLLFLKNKFIKDQRIFTYEFKGDYDGSN